MQLSLTACLIFALIIPETASLSGLAEDLEGSGYDLDGSGSGDDPDKETYKKPGPANVSNPANANTDTAKSSSTLKVGSSHRRDGDAAQDYVIISNTKSSLENKEIAGAAIAGGIMGATIGVLLSVILIYKWRKKHKEECIPYQKKASDEDHLKPIKGVVFI